MVNILGQDNGFGQVDSVFNGKMEKYLSVVGIPSSFRLGDDIQRNREIIDDMYVDYRNQRYYVGNKALRETKNAGFIQQPDKYSSSLDYVKLLASVGLMNPDQKPFYIVTGLPVFEYNLYKEELKKTWEVKTRFSFRGEPMILNVQGCYVIPQAGGAYYDVILDEEGNIVDNIAEENILVIDIGYRTTDIVSMIEGSYDSERSLTSYVGVKEIHGELKKWIQQTYKKALDFVKMDEIIRQGYFFMSGEKIYIHDQVKTIVPFIINKILSDMGSYIEDYSDYHGILLAGGGSILMEKELINTFSQYTNVALIEDAEHANARGYYKYGRLLEANNMLEG